MWQIDVKPNNGQISLSLAQGAIFHHFCRAELGGKAFFFFLQAATNHPENMHADYSTAPSKRVTDPFRRRAWISFLLGIELTAHCVDECAYALSRRVVD